jgi:hypothetical protein
MRAAILLHRQRCPEDLQQLLVWYKIRDIFFGENNVDQNIKKALELASFRDHPNAVWLTNLFAGRGFASPEEARRVFLGCDNDSRALCFAAVLEGNDDEICRAADLGDAFAQSKMAWETPGEECF